ncbi:hypothetical protein TVAG_314050 [Trichomonas vaginalis G3]|uniref:DUF3447 domain-containing protein n=1 Tax=Trichomonas vaginalis (strain ATCC PRA-98 / G3) TaxID=412133 RepID=A2EKK3_TRIV3|nr:Ankyrin repeat family [Trichomonas vaginalis G3]EAY06830.1 hypothetical protein TVAG_314050 [Trichomonas vaginalis G3]KAI5535446.1 Ankyrin repeat family [Trichomonas vaginalis G3]|eukprot:XP_001319053.1 hypothetical protein [Trichomonas vaginalis G3]
MSSIQPKIAIHCFSYDKITENFRPIAHIEDQIFNINETNYNQNLEQLKFGLEKNAFYISRCISKAATFKLFNWKLYYKLITDLHINLSTITAHYFKEYIRKYKDPSYISYDFNENYTLSDIESVFIPKTPEYEASHNNISYFKSLTIDDQLIKRETWIPLDFEFFFTEKCGQKVNLLDIAALCGSADVFEYLLANGFKITSRSTYFALIGGNIDISMKCLNVIWMSDAIHVAVAAHQNNLLNYLVENGFNIRIPLSIIFYEFNTYAFGNLVGQNIAKIDKMMSKFYIKNLTASIRFNLACYANYFIENNVADNVNEFGYSNLCISCAYADYEIIEKLIQKNLDVNHQTDDGECPFTIALSRNRFDVCNLLISNGCDFLSKPDDVQKLLLNLKLQNKQKAVQYIESKMNSQK